MTSRRLASVPETPPRAVLYLRQSVSKEDSISLELQETAGRDHCVRMGYQVVGVEADPGISGRTWARPAVLRVMGMVEAREVDVVVLWKWSRLSRSRRDWAVAIDKIESIGGRIESATEPVDTATATGRFTRGMLAEMAAFESERIGEVWAEILDRRISQGLPGSGGDRVGYIRQDDGTYLSHPVDGPNVAEAYRRYVDGQSMGEITDWLNTTTTKTTHGNHWQRHIATQFLDSGFGAGLLVKNKRINGKTHRAIRDKTWLPGTQERLIPRELWDAYLARRLDPKRSPQQAPSRTYLLSGLMTCECGARMWIMEGRAQQAFLYVCSAYLRKQGVRCVSVTRHRAENAAMAALREYAVGIEAEAPAQAARRTLNEANIAELSRHRTQLTKHLNKLTQGWYSDLVPDAAYAAESHDLTAQIAEIDRALQQAESPRVVPTRREVAGMLEEWDELPIVERRRIAHAVLQPIVVHPPEVRGKPSTIVVLTR